MKTILAVDDDHLQLNALARSLRLQKTVYTTTDSQSALELARRQRPDLAIIDMHLGGASGIALVRTLRAEFPDMVIALVSAYLSVEATVMAVRAGADHVLPKPILGHEILRRLDEALPDEPDYRETPTLERAEAEHIARVLADCGGNISEAARRLGVYRSSLQRRLRKLMLKT